MIADEAAIEGIIQRLDRSLAKLFVWIVDLRLRIAEEYPDLKSLPSAGDMLASERHAEAVMRHLLDRIANYPAIWDEIEEPDVADQLHLRAAVGLRLKELFYESREKYKSIGRSEA